MPRGEVDIPGQFLERMRQLLGEEFEAFSNSLSQPPTTGLRANTLKLTPETFQKTSPFPTYPIPWCPSGFLTSDGYEPGKHPYHAAGLYYLQEPSAMAVAELLAPQPGELVLDLAAAPGGKATHIAALMNNQGLLFANEIHPKRVWTLAENLERCGVRNAVILNESPERIAEAFGPIFDKVLVDAPCSGEGMFRRSQNARKEWSPKLVQGCAQRQDRLLETASRLVRPGGKLVYATCTFSPEENEGTVARFLAAHPHYLIEKAPEFQSYSPGQPGWVDDGAPDSLKRTIRLWPHKISGEGHFIAVLPNGAHQPNRVTRKWNPVKPPGSILRRFDQFCQDNLVDIPNDSLLTITGSYLYLVHPELPDLSGLHIIHPGWWVGLEKKDRFEPSHALAMGMRIEGARRQLNWATEPQGKHIPKEVFAYLRGESLNCKEMERYITIEGTERRNGWVLVALDGYPLGWGKIVNDSVKNYYPKGLRRV